jgi:3-isopropylmalate/(R)-2-methylmalate dehydratase small subunit
MEMNTVLKGKVWVVKDKKGHSIDNIDTDQIYHNKFLTITDKNKMKDYAFSNLSGWKDFPGMAKEGDILAVGKNFGAGSSRQQAVDCFSSLGIKVIIGESFGAIYKRNAINSGFPILECQDITSKLASGEEIDINFLKGKITVMRTGEVFQCKPFSNIQCEIYEAGGLFNIKPQ